MAKGKLNITRDTFLEKEELDRLVSFINDNPALFLFVSSTQQFGIIQQSVIDPAFLVQVGTNANSVKIEADSYALDQNGLMIYQKAFDNLPVPTDGLYYWMKISHRYDNYEVGFVDIAADGTLSGAGTAFTEVLRGNSSGFPVKVKFFVQADDGSLSAANNSGIYELVNVSGNTTAVISGNFTPETNLRYVVLGAFSIKTSVGSITSNGMYSYDSCQIDFVVEETTDTPPVTGYTAGEDFYIARIMNDGAGTFTVEDKRLNYYFRLNFGDISISDRAMVDASNLSAGNITAWLTTLSLYTVSQIDTALTAFLQKSQNLNDLDNKTTARTNLDVYSTGTIEAHYPLRTKYVNIGDWNMVSDTIYPGTDLLWTTIGIPYSKVYDVRCIIKADINVSLIPKYSLDGSFMVAMVLQPSGAVTWNDTEISLVRNPDGLFNSVNFDSTSYSRGWVIIYYSA